MMMLLEGRFKITGAIEGDTPKLSSMAIFVVAYLERAEILSSVNIKEQQ
jgi:hypothetical protein